MIYLNDNHLATAYAGCESGSNVTVEVPPRQKSLSKCWKECYLNIETAGDPRCEESHGDNEQLRDKMIPINSRTLTLV